MRNLNKKKFLFCYPHTLTTGLEASVYRGFRGEGKCEGVRAEMGEGDFFLGEDIGKYQNGIVWKTIRLFLLLYFCTM